jgi:hypothetical protein
VTRLPRQANDDAEKWYWGVVLTYGAICLVDGHSAIPLGLLTPFTWVDLMHSHGRLGPWLSGVTHLSLFAFVALVTAAAWLWLDRGDGRGRRLQAVSVLCLAASAVIACRASEFAPFTLMSFMPFAGAVYGYVFFALGPPPAS